MSPEDQVRYDEYWRSVQEGQTPQQRYDAIGSPGIGVSQGLGNTFETQDSVQTKLDTYLLDKNHPSGGSKADWFDKSLGYNQSNSSELANQIVFDPKAAVRTELTQYGQKFEQMIKINGANCRLIDVKFVWITNNDGITRLVTAIPTAK